MLVTYRHRLYRVSSVLATAVVLEDLSTGQLLVVVAFGPDPGQADRIAA